MIRIFIAFILGVFLTVGVAYAIERNTDKDLKTKQQAENIYKQLHSADKYKAADLYHDLAELHDRQCVIRSQPKQYRLRHSFICDEMVRELLMNAYFGE